MIDSCKKKNAPNVTLRHVRITRVAVEEQLILHIRSVWL
jgi:hypothetical protein